MSNYVQTRIKSVSQAKIMNLIKHNLRKVQPRNSIREDLFHNKFGNFHEGMTYKEMSKFVKEKRKEHEELWKIRNGNRQLTESKNINSFANGVVTLSPIINDMIEDGDITPKQLNDLFRESVNELMCDMQRQQSREITLMSFDIHYTEKTPHAHFIFDGFGDDSLSLVHKLKTTETLSQMQDTVGEVFKDYGFIRGEKKIVEKDENGKSVYVNDHKNIRQMHLKEGQILRDEIKELKNEKTDILADVLKSTGQKKIELDGLDRKIKEKRVEKKELEEGYKKLLAEVKETTKNNFIKTINKDFKDIETKCTTKGIFSDTVDYEKAFKKSKSYAAGVQNYHIEMKENKLLTKDNEKLRDSDNKLREFQREQTKKINNLEQKVDETDKIKKQNEELSRNYKHLINEKSNLEKDMDRFSEENGLSFSKWKEKETEKKMMPNLGERKDIDRDIEPSFKKRKR